MTDKTEQLDEFQASMGDPSMVPEPVATKSNKRPADKTQGDKSPEKLTRAGMIAATVGKLSGMDKNGVASAYATMFGKGPAHGGGSAKNMATIKGVREDVEEMFEGQELTEEFMERAATIFEAAVVARVTAEVQAIEEELSAQFAQEQEQMMEEVNAKVDEYVSYAAAEWLKENEVAIESSIKVELAESFLGGLKDLFEQHNVHVTDEMIDVVAEAESKAEELEARLDEEIRTRMELQNQIDELNVQRTIASFAEGLTATQQEKLQTMAEGIEYESLEDFEKKLDVIKETYFASKSVITEEVDEEPLDEAEEKAAIDPLMERYASAISRTIKR